jgi:hypothetical protein
VLRTAVAPQPQPCQRGQLPRDDLKVQHARVDLAADSRRPVPEVARPVSYVPILFQIDISPFSRYGPRGLDADRGALADDLADRRLRSSTTRLTRDRRRGSAPRPTGPAGPPEGHAVPVVPGGGRCTASRPA